MKKKKLMIMLGVLLVVILLTTIILLIELRKSKQISNLEEIKINETSKTTMLFMEEIETSKDLDRYISYALEYSYNIDDKDTLTTKEIKDFIEKRFNVTLGEEELNNIGVTPYLLDKSIGHNPEEKTYRIDKSGITQPMIAKIPVVKYEINSMKKKKNKFIVTYDKYVVANPYEILNYYNDSAMNIPEDQKENYQPYDTSAIYNYLTCKGKITTLKDAITKDNIEKIGKIDKQLEVTYIIKDDNLVIENIK